MLTRNRVGKFKPLTRLASISCRQYNTRAILNLRPPKRKHAITYDRRSVRSDRGPMMVRSRVRFFVPKKHAPSSLSGRELVFSTDFFHAIKTRRERERARTAVVNTARSARFPVCDARRAEPIGAVFRAFN